MVLKKICISLLIIGVFSTITFLIYTPTKSGLGDMFGPTIVYILVRDVALFAGVGLFLLRFPIHAISLHLVYMFIGILNICVGLLATCLFFYQHATIEWVHACLINLLAGVVISCDYFRIGRNS